MAHWWMVVLRSCKGKIQGVGSSISAPASAVIQDFGDAYIVPGFVDLSTSLGIGGALSDQIALNTKLGEWLARDDRQIALARQGGVTTAFLSSTRLPSPVVAFKLGDNAQRVERSRRLAIRTMTVT